MSVKCCLTRYPDYQKNQVVVAKFECKETECSSTSGLWVSERGCLPDANKQQIFHHISHVCVCFREKCMHHCTQSLRLSSPDSQRFISNMFSCWCRVQLLCKHWCRKKALPQTIFHRKESVFPAWRAWLLCEREWSRSRLYSYIEA